MGQEQSLPSFQGGKIYIDVDTNTCIAGSTVKGTVHIYQQQVFQTSQLVLQLVGREKTTYSILAAGERGTAKYENNFNIID